MSGFSKEEKKQVQSWLLQSFEAASSFDGSEASEERLYNPLSLFDDFVRAHNDGSPSEELEISVSRNAFPKHPVEMPETVDGFLDIATEFYERLKDTSPEFDIFEIIQNAGGIVTESDKVFVHTDEGQLQRGHGDNTQSYEIKTEPRLAILIEHLRNDGVNGQSIYMDDLVITQGKVSAEMMREYPYNIVQIPRINMEIAVCDQIGETTFVKKGTIGAEFWDHLSKGQFKEHEDVTNVDRHNDQQWWGEISSFLSGNAEPTKRKVNVESWSKKKPSLDIILVKESLLAHHEETDEWLSASKTGEDGKKGNYVLEHGPYAGQITAGNLNQSLVKELRNLGRKSSIALLNEEISQENGLDYVNRKNQDNLNIGLIKEGLLAHHEETGEWLSASKKGADGKNGSYVLEHGPYAKQITAKRLDSVLRRDGERGLSGETSIAQLNEEISEEKGLDYVNRGDQDHLDMALIKKSLLAHREETGEWLSASKEGPDNKKGSYVLEHGHYAGQITAANLNASLMKEGARGLSGVSSIAQLNEEISEENGLDYVNHLKQDDLDITLIKESLLAHREETDEWLSASKTGEDGKKGSYILEHGPYAEQITVSSLESALIIDGARGLFGKSSVPQLNEEISQENGLDYVNRKNQDDLDIELIKESLLAHRQETGEWLSVYKKIEGGKEGSYVLEHGHYAGQITVSLLENALNKDGARGLFGKSSVAQLNEEISQEKSLDYVNRGKQDHLDMALIKDSLLANREETGEWLSSSKTGNDDKKGSYVLEHGHYAGQITVGALNAALITEGLRGLSGKSSIAQLNEEISEENGFDFVNCKNKANLDMILIKESLLAHYEETDKWLACRKPDESGKIGGYILEHGPYAEQITVGALENALRKDGARGLSGKSTVSKINKELKAELIYTQNVDSESLIDFTPE